MTPEEKARRQIDTILTGCGWIVQDKSQMNLHPAKGVALRELPFKSGVKFTRKQIAWLNLIRDHIATSLSIDPEDFNLAPFSQQGGLGKAHQLFGSDLPKLLDELNEVLAA